MLPYMNELKAGVSHGALMIAVQHNEIDRERRMRADIAEGMKAIGDGFTKMGEQFEQSAESAKQAETVLAALTGSYGLGAEVSWTSSNTTKRGAITHVIPAGKLPSDLGVKIKDEGQPRDHESYIVRGWQIDRTGNQVGRNTTYWPRVSLLKLATA